MSDHAYVQCAYAVREKVLSACAAGGYAVSADSDINDISNISNEMRKALQKAIEAIAEQERIDRVVHCENNRYVAIVDASGNCELVKTLYSVDDHDINPRGGSIECYGSEYSDKQKCIVDCDDISDAQRLADDYGFDIALFTRENGRRNWQLGWRAGCLKEDKGIDLYAFYEDIDEIKLYSKSYLDDEKQYLAQLQHDADELADEIRAERDPADELTDEDDVLLDGDYCDAIALVEKQKALVEKLAAMSDGDVLFVGGEEDGEVYPRYVMSWYYDSCSCKVGVYNSYAF